MTQNTFSDTSLAGADFLEHYGVKGMKWGVRRDLKKLPTKKARETYVSEKDAKWKTKTEDPKRAIRAAKRASRDATRMTKKLNKKYKGMGYKLKGNSLRKNNLNNRKNRLARSQYDIELRGVLESSLDSAAYKVYKNSPSRLYQVDLKRSLDGTISAKVVPRQNAKLDKQRASITNKARKLKHSDDGVKDLAIKLVEDEDGFVIDVQLPEFDLEMVETETAMEHTSLAGSDFLEHHGVKGMKWGVRKDGKPQGYQGGSTKSTKSSGVKKRVKKAVSDAVDPEKRADRKLEKAKRNYEIQKKRDEAKALENVTKALENAAKSSRTTSKAASEAPPKRVSAPKASSMTDEELKEFVKRLENEKKMSILMEERRPKSNAEKVNKFLKKAAAEALGNATKQAMNRALGAAVTNSFAKIAEAGQEGLQESKQKTQQKSQPKQQRQKRSQPTSKVNTGPLHGPKSPGPLQGPKSPGPLQGPRNTGPLHGPKSPGPLQGPKSPGPLQGPRNTGPLHGPKSPGPLQGPRNSGPRMGPSEAPRQLGLPTTRAPLEPVPNLRNIRVIETTPSLQSVLSKSYSETKASAPSTAGKSWLDQLNWDEPRRRR